MSNYIFPILLILLIVYSTIKKNNTYQSFVDGAKTSFDLVLTSLPYIVAMFVAIEVFQVSHLSAYLSTALSPIFSFFGIPTQLAPLVLLKPFSGCGSLAVLQNIFSTYGVDSYLARAGCAIAGSSEAIFYVTAVYFVKTKVTKFRYAIPICILANFAGVIVACLICKII